MIINFYNSIKSTQVNKVVNEVDRKLAAVCFNKCYGKVYVGFSLNREKHLLEQVLLLSQQEDLRFPQKTVLGIFETALRVRDQYAFM